MTSVTIFDLNELKAIFCIDGAGTFWTKSTTRTVMPSEAVVLEIPHSEAHGAIASALLELTEVALIDGR